jgi:hypothetical protein
MVCAANNVATAARRTASAAPVLADNAWAADRLPSNGANPASEATMAADPIGPITAVTVPGWISAETPDKIICGPDLSVRSTTRGPVGVTSPRGR